MNPFTVKGGVSTIGEPEGIPGLLHHSQNRAGGSELSGFFVPPTSPDVEDPPRPTPMSEVNKSESGNS